MYQFCCLSSSIFSNDYLRNDNLDYTKLLNVKVNINSLKLILNLFFVSKWFKAFHNLHEINDILLWFDKVCWNLINSLQEILRAYPYPQFINLIIYLIKNG